MDEAFPSRTSVSGDRRTHLWRLVVELAGGQPIGVAHVAAATIVAAGVDSAALTVTLSATGSETMYASDEMASELEDLAQTLGEGPPMDARVDGPILVADLTTSDCLARWPAYAPAASQVGLRAVFALPVRVGAIRLGVMDLYRRQTGDLDRDQLADALTLTDTACALLLDGSSRGSSRRSSRRSSRSDGHAHERAGLQHPEIHQATGMISVQLGVTVAVALVRLRAHAYAHDRPLREVAADVVARRLRLRPD